LEDVDNVGTVEAVEACDESVDLRDQLGLLALSCDRPNWHPDRRSPSLVAVVDRGHPSNDLDYSTATAVARRRCRHGHRAQQIERQVKLNDPARVPVERDAAQHPERNASSRSSAPRRRRNGAACMTATPGGSIAAITVRESVARATS